MSNISKIILAIGGAIFLASVCACFKKSSPSLEHYRDPIWMNKKKMYNDYYPRSNGSIYGNYYQPWDMFTGYPTFPKAY
jgi:uncharacterized membrane protein YbaN (DUF454 family)